MGLRGAGAGKKKKAVGPRARFRPAAWKHKRSRVARVISFLEALPITKGILAGTKMKLLPGQREFVQAIYGRLSTSSSG